jgi:non-heme chloroperoxidase
MTREYEIRGGGGIRLHAREWGNADGPAILFIHGWSQCELCWSAQVGGQLATSFRMVTFDNRGHGMSEKPLDPSCYADERLWADDLAAVIDQTGLERPVLVAWSYGGFIVADYLRMHGDGAIAGIDLVGGAVVLAPPTFDHLALCWNMVVPPQIRGALIAREIDAADVLATVSVPVMVTHGLEDAIVLPSMAEHTLEHCPTAVESWYEGVGHMPFVEHAERFDRELATFVDRATATYSSTAPV